MLIGTHSLLIVLRLLGTVPNSRARRCILPVLIDINNEKAGETAISPAMK